MPLTEWLIRLLIAGLLGTIGSLYWRGWQQLRQAGSPLAKPFRLTMLLGSMLLILLATWPPLYSLSHEILYARAVQKIMVAMVAAPLFWLACPVHIILRSLPFAWRSKLYHMVQPETWSG
ncbi:MAG: cytochrome c oxidase assembly protein, partial [Caldilineaceae bacterium]|nr:cytochrome c oxidase assembly protein [Caldilineaceae bacterium]